MMDANRAKLFGGTIWVVLISVVLSASTVFAQTAGTKKRDDCAKCFPDEKTKIKFIKEHNCRLCDVWGVTKIYDRYQECCISNGPEVDERTGVDLALNTETGKHYEYIVKKDDLEKIGECCANEVQNKSNGMYEVTGQTTKGRQIKWLEKDFDWEQYQRQCPNMRQSESPPDHLWPQCEVGKPHMPDDVWPIRQVWQDPKKPPNARPHCIDGCSTPQAAVDGMMFWINSLYGSAESLGEDKDNPAGHPLTSIYEVCVNHDLCYQSCIRSQTRVYCDYMLYKEIMDICETIPVDDGKLTQWEKHIWLIIGIGIKSPVKPKNVETRKRCEAIALSMYLGLQLGGQSAFDLRKQQYCQCC